MREAKADRWDRRRFLKGAGAAAALACSPSPARAIESLGRSDRPNILVIMSDEHNAGVLGCYGNTTIRTPNLDALSRQGVTFDACYCNSPLCVPSRLSFTSGKYASRVGAWNNNCWLPALRRPPTGMATPSPTGSITLERRGKTSQ